MVSNETVKAVLFDPHRKPNVRACFSLVDVPRQQQEHNDACMDRLEELVGGGFEVLQIKGYDLYFHSCAAIDDQGYDGSWWRFLPGPHHQAVWPFPPGGQCLLGRIVYLKQGGRSCTVEDIKELDRLCTFVQHGHKQAAMSKRHTTEGAQR